MAAPPPQQQQDSVQLLTSWPSASCVRAELALVFKNISYEKIPQDVSNKSQLLLTSNPVHKKIPVLIHNGNIICESSIIVQYIDETWPSPHGNNLLPNDPYDRAVARFWADYMDSKVSDALIAVLKTKGEAQKAAVEVAMECFTTLEGALQTVPKEPPFFGGATIGYADIIWGSLAAWYSAFEAVGNFTIPYDKFPRFHAWVKALKESSIGTSLPDSEEVKEFVVNVLRKRFVGSD